MANDTLFLTNLIPADNEHIQYTGRIDFSFREAPLFIYAGSYLKARFTGTELKAVIQNRKNWGRQFIGYIIDHAITGKILLNEDDQKRVYTLADNLADTEHEVILYKCMDSTGYFRFFGFLLDSKGTLLPQEEKPKRRIECFGDSVSAGAVCEAWGWEGKPDPPHNGEYCNAWYSYIAMTARNLGAELHNNSQGGLSLLNGTGYFRMPETLGLEFTYDKLGYVPELGLSQWDFNRFTPHVVVMAIGQNDPHPDNDISRDEGKKLRWKTKYKEILRDLRGHYPKALFILTTTLLYHDPCWDQALEEICLEMQDEKIVKFTYKRNGKGTPGHLRILEHKEMADELTEFIKSFGESLWE